MERAVEQQPEVMRIPGPDEERHPAVRASARGAYSEPVPSGSLSLQDYPPVTQADVTQCGLQPASYKSEMRVVNRGRLLDSERGGDPVVMYSWRSWRRGGGVGSNRRA